MSNTGKNENSGNICSSIFQSLNHNLRMKQRNFVSINQIPFIPKMFKMCPEMELVEVKSWFSFKVTNQTKPIISQEMIDQRDAESNSVFVKIPLNKIIFMPYQNTGDRGILRISLQIPHIELPIIEIQSLDRFRKYTLADNLLASRILSTKSNSPTATTLHYLCNVSNTTDILEHMENAFGIVAPTSTKQP